MSEDHLASKETDLGQQLDDESSPSIGVSALIFPKSVISNSSSGQIILSKPLDNEQNLDGGESIASFAIDDITVSSNAVTRAAPMVSMSHLNDTTEGLGQGFTLVGSSGGEFMIVSSGADSINLDSSGGIQQRGQTLTLNLDEATRYLLQQQTGITRAVELPDGTFQLLDQPLVQVEREDGTLEAQTLHIEVLQALQGDLAQQLPSIDPTYAIGEDMDSLDEATSSSIIKTEPSSNMPMEESHNKDSLDPGDMSDASGISISVSGSSDKKCQEDYDSASGSDHVKEKRHQGSEGRRVMVKREAEYKQPDLTSPIPLSDQTIITVKGKKCILAFNQETQQVCAYPLKPPPGTKRRGRPRMTEEEKAAAAADRKKHQHFAQFVTSGDAQVSPSEKSTAAETLLELSNVGSDGIRRSARKRKKAKLFEEYEELEDSDEEKEPPFEDNQEKDPDINLNLPDAKKKKLSPKKEAFVSAPTVFVTTQTQSVKRGRGRPRRYPPPGQQQTPTSIPAVMIPSANGQTLVMTPIHGLQNLQNFRRQLPSLIPKPATDTNTPSITVTVSSATDASDPNTLPLGGDTDSLPLDTSGVLDSNSIIPTALQGDTISLVGDNADSSDHGDIMDPPCTSTSPLGFSTQKTASEKSKDGQSAEGVDMQTQPTVIQIPDNLLASLGFKKDPIKIGLKANERELEKLKCPKCDFQGYYVQQYRNHIATHGDDIQKCKCCSYLSLDSDELLQHFKEYHPRCICSECGYMAEHAYIIKRHMMRHDTKSCTCNVCGKVYKDMYILKMHIKMVHMPAEILFECNVCAKKFTRKAHLKRHLRIHEPEKPYKCPICDYRGCERSDISKHMLIHEEPKHTCERCGKTFRHIKNKELHVKRHDGQRDYKCGVCDFFGYTFTDIRKHIERKHQDIKTLICDKCNKHFRNELALKEHQQTCNVLMIEQVLAIPTSAGGTSQATIQIPTNLGPDGHIILDGQAITVDGQTIAVNKNGTVNIIVAAGEEQLGLVEGTTEEEEEELEDEEGGINQAMQIISETIMTESNEEMHIITQEALHSAGQMQQEGQMTGSVPVIHEVDDAEDIVDRKRHTSNPNSRVGEERIPNVNHGEVIACQFMGQSEQEMPESEIEEQDARQTMAISVEQDSHR